MEPEVVAEPDDKDQQTAAGGLYNKYHTHYLLQKVAPDNMTIQRLSGCWGRLKKWLYRLVSVTFE